MHSILNVKQCTSRVCIKSSAITSMSTINLMSTLQRNYNTLIHGHIETLNAKNVTNYLKHYMIRQNTELSENLRNVNRNEKIHHV